MANQYRVGTHCTTIVMGRDGWTRITYHQTVVVAFKMDRIVFDSGGWRSATTKVRINQACQQFALDGWGVYQRDGVWYLQRFDQVSELQEAAILFEDGIEIDRRTNKPTGEI